MMPQASRDAVRLTELHERHTTGLGGAAASVEVSRPSSPTVTGALTAADIRDLSKSLFARLADLEEGTPEYSYVRNSLVELNLNLVHYAARRLRVRGDSYEDVVQVGTIGLIKAIDRFELQRGAEFTSFALPTVMGEIKRFFRDTTWAVHVPRRMKELGLNIGRASARLEQTNGQAPSVAELADHLGLGEGEVAEGLTAAKCSTAASLDWCAGAEDPDDSLADHIGCHDPELTKAENVQALKPAIAALPQRERELLALRFVEEMTQAEIGRELGVSQMHVSRLLSRTLGRLRAQLDA